MYSYNGKSKENAVIIGDHYRITILSEVLIRLEYSKTNTFNDYPTTFAINRDFPVPAFTKKEDENYLVVSTNYFRLQYKKGYKFNKSKIAPENYLRIELLDSDKVWYYGHPEARNFKTTGDLSKELKERLIKGLYSTDGFVSIDDSSTMLIGEDGSLLDRIKEEDYIDTYVFLYRRDFGKCLSNYYNLTGYPRLIPRYALGIWWNRNNAYSASEIKRLIHDFNKYGIPLSVLLLGSKWKDIGYNFNQDLILKPKELFNYLHERGICVGLEINPKDGILTTDANTIPFNVLDKTFVKLYFESILNYLNNLGVDFYWNNYDGDIKNSTALNYLYYKKYDSDSKRRGMVLTKDNTISAHRYPVLYSGESIVSWDSIKDLPYYNSLASNIGVSWWSHDIGGYKNGIEDWELYIRYVQLGCFSPIFRFSSEEGKYYKREPWKWDIRTLNMVRSYTELRHRLIPYLYSEAYNYSKTGLPIVQPLYYLNPSIYDEPEFRNEYYFGKDILVSPIVKEKDDVMNRAVERIFLPNGVWYDFKTGKKFPGGKRLIAFYKDEDYPVFARNGAIIPLSILGENLNITNSPKSMEIHIFPGRSNNYTLYEDDGYSDLFEEGYYIKTNIEYNYQQNNYTVIIRPVEGKKGIIPDNRNYKIRFRNTLEATDVIVYEKDELRSSNYYVEDSDFIVEVNDVDTTKQLTINCKGKDIEIDAKRIINEDIDSIINDLMIETKLKEKISLIIFSDIEIKKKRIKIRKLKKDGLESIFIRMFLKLLDYIAEI